MAEWMRTVSTTITDYMKGVEDEFMRDRKLLKAMKSKGRIKYNCSGIDFRWQVPYKRGTVVTNNGAQGITPTPVDRFKNATLAWSGYVISDLQTKREHLMNRGSSAVIEYWENAAGYLGDDLSEKFSEDLYIDSSASGNSARMSGIETMMGTNGTVTISTGDQRSANNADVVYYPSDTYAGLSTILGNYAGSWESQTGIGSTWPAGRGTDSYDFYSPTIVNFSSTAFGTGLTTWAGNCESAIRYLNDHLGRNKGSNVPDMLMLDRELYRLFKEKYSPMQRVAVGSAQTEHSFGFKDSIDFEGLTVTKEYGIPSGVGYAFNIKNMELRSLQDKLFKTTGPWFEKLSNAFCVVVDNLGQLKFHSPRYFGKLTNVA